MSEAVTIFIAEQRERFTAFRKELTSESDRGCALFAAAFLDKALSDLHYVSLVANKKIEADLFNSQGPLASFSSRIKFAYYLGKLSPSERHDLDTIRAIRNEFAHHAEAITFEKQSVRNRCANLTFHWHENGAQARDKFTGAVSGLLAHIHVETLRAIAPTEKKNPLISETRKQEVRLKARGEVVDDAACDGAGT